VTLEALEGFTVGVTADRRWEQQADLLSRRGATILHGPTLATHYLAETAALMGATAEVAAGVDLTVVTTGIGVRAWFDAAETSGVAEELRRAVGSSRILCRGPKAAAALQVAGVETAPLSVSESLSELLVPFLDQAVSGARVAFQHHGAADSTWVGRLTDAGARVVEVPVYRWQRPPSDDAARRLVRATCAGEVDAVTFTSAPAVTNLVRIAAEHGLAAELLEAFNGGGVIAACVGPICAAGARHDGIETPLAPEVGRLGLLVRVVTEALSRRSVRWRAGEREVVLQGRALAVGEERFVLSERERKVLARLSERPGVVVAKSVLARQLGISPRAVEAGVGRIRSRTGDAGRHVIQTVQGRGYRLGISRSGNLGSPE
jgi:uroporphyrinogen-III synthase